MPRIVDHDQRRAEVVDLCIDLIADTDPHALTFREIARVAGCSTSIISHYFNDKRDLHLAMYRRANESARADFLAVEAHDPGDLQGYLETLLPLDRVRRQRCRMWLVFTAMCTSDPAFAQEYSESFAVCLADIRRLVTRNLPRESDAEEQAITVITQRLLAIVQGIMAPAVIDPERWPASRQRSMLAIEIGALRQGAAVLASLPIAHLAGGAPR